MLTKEYREFNVGLVHCSFFNIIRFSFSASTLPYLNPKEEEQEEKVGAEWKQFARGGGGEENNDSNKRIMNSSEIPSRK